MSARLAGALTRALLRLYPRAFRVDVGEALVANVERRGRELRRAGRLPVLLWLPRLVGSLLANAAAAWAGRARMRTVSLLDLKIALRMLSKHPGLAVPGGLGIAVAVALGIGFYALSLSRFHPVIPLDEGERLVGLENRDVRSLRADRRALHDFARWRESMTTVENMTAFRTVPLNLIAEDGAVELMRAAEITAAGFRLARVPALLGRTLVDSDEALNATPVVVIGFEVWQARFAADPDIVGKDLRLGATPHRIVGVMPEGYAFPVDHRYWIPLKATAGPVDPGEGPPVFVAARLSPGADLADARAEIEVLGERLAGVSPETHAHLRPDVLPYTYPFAGMGRGAALAVTPLNIVFALALVIVCVNVAILVYARTVTRRGEIAIRTALGASRGRIVGQLFAEALVLSGSAAATGYLVVAAGLDTAHDVVEAGGSGAFWSDYAMPASGPIYLLGLTLLSALITGVVPGLQATSRRVQSNLARFHGTSGAHLGRTWMALLVAQVALAVAVVPLVAAGAWYELRSFWSEPAYPVEKILFARLSLHDLSSGDADDPAAEQERLRALGEELGRRLDGEPGVSRYTFMSGAPGHGERLRAQLIDDTAAGPSFAALRSTVGPDYFQTFDLDLQAGRAFRSGDGSRRGPDPVVVNRVFADRIGRQGGALGATMRYLAEDPSDDAVDEQERRYRIVGIAADVLTNPFDDTLVEPRVYHLLQQGDGGNALAVRVAGVERGTLAAKLRGIAAALDPALQLEIVPLQEGYRFERSALVTTVTGLGIALLSVLLLSAAGIYALMSFTVAQRRREIAVRSALGASPARLLRGVFRRALGQIALGVAIGIGLAVLVDGSSNGDVLRAYRTTILTLMVLTMTVVGLLAALGPARRTLAVEPSEILKGG